MEKNGWKKGPEKKVSQRAANDRENGVTRSLPTKPVGQALGAEDQERVGEFRRRPESEPFFRLAKQAMLVLSSLQPDAARRKKGRSKPDRILRQAPRD